MRLIALIAVLGACGPKAAHRGAKSVETAEIAVPIPDGYRDLSAAMRAELHAVAVAFEGPRNSVIVFQKAEVRGGAIDDAACAERGNAIIENGRRAQESPPRLDGAIVFRWTGGTGCEYRYATPQSVTTLLVEFHPADPGGADPGPREVWTMTCQYDAGDASAIATCRGVGAAFKLRGRAP